MHQVENVVGPAVATADRVRGIDAHRQVGEVAHCRHVAEIHQIAVRIAQIGLHATQAENDIAIALAGEILGSVERFLQRDAETSLEQHG